MEELTESRIFFDTNEGSMAYGYWLGFERSKKDLNAVGPVLAEGLKVTIYMPKELEMRATLRLGEDLSGSTDPSWWADPIPDTIRYLDGSAS